MTTRVYAGLFLLTILGQSSVAFYSAANTFLPENSFPSRLQLASIGEEIPGLGYDQFSICFQVNLKSPIPVIQQVPLLSYMNAESQMAEIVLKLEYERQLSSLYVGVSGGTFFPAIPTSQWTHVCLTWDGTTGKVSAYFDGRPVKISNALQQGNKISGNGYFTFGPQLSQLGQLSNLHFWNRIISQPEVQQNQGCLLQGNLLSWVDRGTNNSPCSSKSEETAGTSWEKPDTNWENLDTSWEKPDTSLNAPKATSSYPKATSSYPKATSSYPKTTSSYPKATSSYPKATSEIPEETTTAAYTCPAVHPMNSAGYLEEFESTDVGFTLVTPDPLPALESISVCSWIYLHTSSGSIPGFLLHSNGLVVMSMSIEHGSLQYVLSDSSNTFYVALNTEKKWYHLCLTWSGRSGELHMFLNGVLNVTEINVSKDYKFPSACVLIITDVLNSAVDANDPTAGYDYKSSDVNVWDRVITEEEVKQVYECSGSLPGNIVNWPDAFWEEGGIYD